MYKINPCTTFVLRSFEFTLSKKRYNIIKMRSFDKKKRFPFCGMHFFLTMNISILYSLSLNFSFSFFEELISTYAKQSTLNDVANDLQLYSSPRTFITTKK